MQLYELSANRLHKLIKNKEVSVEEIVISLFQRIEEVEEKVKAFLFLYKKEALEEARKWDKRISQGEDIGPLSGIPIAIKDNICLDKKETRCASRILKEFYPPYAATAIERLKKAGVIFIGNRNKIGRAHV